MKPEERTGMERMKEERAGAERLERLERKYGRRSLEAGNGAGSAPGGRGPGAGPGGGPRMPGPGRRGAGMPVSKPQNAGKTIGRLLSYIGEDKWKMGIFIFCIVLYTVANLTGSYLPAGHQQSDIGRGQQDDAVSFSASDGLHLCRRHHRPVFAVEDYHCRFPECASETAGRSVLQAGKTSGQIL